MECIFAHPPFKGGKQYPPPTHMTCVYGGVKLFTHLLFYDTCHPFKRGVMVTSPEGGWAKMFSKKWLISLFFEYNLDKNKVIINPFKFPMFIIQVESTIQPTARIIFSKSLIQIQLIFKNIHG